jgi:transposase-like protein
MRKSKFTDSQIMDAVKRVEAGFAVPDICRELGVGTATFYNWRAKYGQKRSMETDTDEKLTMIDNILNHRPRKRLGFTTPNEVFHASLNCVTPSP